MIALLITAPVPVPAFRLVTRPCAPLPGWRPSQAPHATRCRRARPQERRGQCRSCGAGNAGVYRADRPCTHAIRARRPSPLPGSVVVPFRDVEEIVGSETLYVPHRREGVAGSVYWPPWVADDPAARADQGQPVFRSARHAMVWLDTWLAEHTKAGMVVAVVEARTFAGRDGRTLVRLDEQQLREPHRQVVVAGPDQAPHPGALRMCYEAAASHAVDQAHQRWGMIWRRSPEAVEAAGRLAFAHGYRTGFSNAGRAVEALVADRLGALRAEAGIDEPVVPARRPWLEAAPVPPVDHPFDPAAVAPDQLGLPPAVLYGWARGIALGAAHGALEATRVFRAAVNQVLGEPAKAVPGQADAALRDALISVVPAWVDRRLATHATAPVASQAPVNQPQRHAVAAFPAATRSDPTVPTAAPVPARKGAPRPTTTAAPARPAGACPARRS